jgi:hypothetical protein
MQPKITPVQQQYLDLLRATISAPEHQSDERVSREEEMQQMFANLSYSFKKTGEGEQAKYEFQLDVPVDTALSQQQQIEAEDERLIAIALFKQQLYDLIIAMNLKDEQTNELATMVNAGRYTDLLGSMRGKLKGYGLKEEAITQHAATVKGYAIGTNAILNKIHDLFQFIKSLFVKQEVFSPKSTAAKTSTGSTKYNPAML